MTLSEALDDGNQVFTMPYGQGVTLKDKCPPKSNLSLQLELANQQQHQEVRGREQQHFHVVPSELNKPANNYTTTHIKRELNLLSSTKGFHNHHIHESEAERNHVILRRLYENDGTKGGSPGNESLPIAALRPAVAAQRDGVSDVKSTMGRSRKDGMIHQQLLPQQSAAVKQTYLNETAFLQALEQKQRVQQQAAASSAFMGDKDSKNHIGSSVNITSNCNNISLLSSSPPTTQSSLSRNISPFLRRSKFRRHRRGSPPPSLSSSIANSVRPSNESPPRDESETLLYSQDSKVTTNYGDIQAAVGAEVATQRCIDNPHPNPLDDSSSQVLYLIPHTSMLIAEQGNLFAKRHLLRSDVITTPHESIPLSYVQRVLLEQTAPSQLPNTSYNRKAQEQPQEVPAHSQQPQPIDHIKNFAVSLGVHTLFGTKPVESELVGQELNTVEKPTGDFKEDSAAGNESNKVLQQGNSCQNCSNLSAQLDVALADIEYLKRMLLLEEENKRREDTTKSILGLPQRQEDNFTPNSGLAYSNKHHRNLKSSGIGDQLQEVTTRHKKQMEQVMKDTLRLQLEMRSKQLKLTDLCRGLNDESVKRKSEAELLQDSVTELQNERDDLAMENLRLRAALEARQKEIAKLEEIRDKYVQNEHSEIQRTADVIDERDQTIEALTARLSIALDRIDQYEYEKQQQQRKKKQFFFPFPLSAPVSPR